MKIKLKPNDILNDILSKAKDGDEIYLFDKEYYEKIKITNNNIKIIGTGANSSIVYKDYYNKISFDNKELLTVRTYTCMVEGDNVSFENLTIKNLANDSKKYGQAVALHILGNNFRCINTRILGGQDTIFLGPLPYDLTLRYNTLLPKDELTQKKSHSLFDNCYIEGDIDFIFGSGISLFNKCAINSIGNGFISAPSHPRDYDIGFVFNECNLTSNKDVDNVYLSRPWRDFGNATFINCNIGSHIKPLLFDKWVEGRDKTCRFSIYPKNKEKVSFARDLDLDKKELILNSFNSIFKD